MPPNRMPPNHGPATTRSLAEVEQYQIHSGACHCILPIRGVVLTVGSTQIVTLRHCVRDTKRCDTIRRRHSKASSAIMNIPAGMVGDTAARRTAHVSRRVREESWRRECRRLSCPSKNVNAGLCFEGGVDVHTRVLCHVGTRGGQANTN